QRARHQVDDINANWDGTNDWKTQFVEPNHFLWPAVGYASLLASRFCLCCPYQEWAQIQTNFYYSLLMPEDGSPVDSDNPNFAHNMFRVHHAGWLLQILRSSLYSSIPL
ncbi:MAG: hypothetical protein ACFFBD_08315, partial [Candidatus Hodarchaeota archaeon]